MMIVPSSHVHAPQSFLRAAAEGEDDEAAEDAEALRRQAETLRLRAEKCRLEATKAELEIATERATRGREALIAEDPATGDITPALEAAAREALEANTAEEIARGDLLKAIISADDEDEDTTTARAATTTTTTPPTPPVAAESSATKEDEPLASGFGAGKTPAEAWKLLEEKLAPPTPQRVFFDTTIPWAVKTMDAQRAEMIKHAAFVGPHTPEWRRVRKDKASAHQDFGFYCTKVMVDERGAIFRGQNLTEAGEALRRTEERLEANATTRGRFRLFIDVNDPLLDREAMNAMTNDDDVAVFAWNLEEKEYMIVAVDKETPARPIERTVDTEDWLDAQLQDNAIFKTIFYALSLSTLGLYAAGTAVLDDRGYDLLVSGDLTRIASTIAPPAQCVLLIQLAHDAGHQIVGAMRNVSISWGVPLPFLTTGLLGSSSVLRSFPPDRKALFDTALAGPGIALLCSIVALTVGAVLGAGLDDGAVHAMISPDQIGQTASGAAASASSSLGPISPRIPAQVIRSSTLASSILAICKPALAKVAVLDAADVAIDVHPLFAAGCVSAIVAALHFLPIGKTDGTRLAGAVLGRRWKLDVVAGGVTFLATLYGIFRNDELLLAHLFFAVAAQWSADDPICRDGATPVGDKRETLYLVALAVALVALLPCPLAGLTAGGGDLFGASSDPFAGLSSSGTSSLAPPPGGLTAVPTGIRDWFGSLFEAGSGSPSVSNLPPGFDF